MAYKFEIPTYWGLRVEWLGWKRCLWLSVSLDFHLHLFGLVLFGLAISYGRHLSPLRWSNAHVFTRPIAEPPADAGEPFDVLDWKNDKSGKTDWLDKEDPHGGFR